MSGARALMAVARAHVVEAGLVRDRAAVAVVASWFASPTVAGFPESVLSVLTSLGVDKPVARTVGELTAVPVLGQTGEGSPTFVRGMSAVERVASDEPMMRALYAVNASRRLSDADDYEVALRNERRYLDAHLAAAANRRDAARRLDGQSGRVLRWVTAGDERVHPDCRRLEGRLFSVGNLPDGFVPGGVRVGCRCRAEPWGHELWAISDF